MAHDESKEQLAQDERRSDVRRPAADGASIRVIDGTVSGKIENLSQGGLFVVLDEPLTIEVEFRGERGVPPRRAHLIRCQSLSGGKSGWGIQFDPEEAGD